MKSNLIALLLISSIMSIKIKIRTPVNQNGGSSGGWNTVRGCNAISNNIEVGSLFSLYAEQIYSICNDPINELLLVKHESQVESGVNHRLIFRIRDTQTNDKLYYGFSLYVDLQGGVRVTGYLESFELSVIIQALGFSDQKLYKYNCYDLSSTTVLGFTEWASQLINGNVTQNEPLDDFNNDPYNNQYGGNSGPFQESTLRLKINGINSDGSRFTIGSKRPR